MKAALALRGLPGGPTRVALDPPSAAQLETGSLYRLLTDAGLSELTLAQYREDIARLREAHADAPERLALLDQLSAWGEGLAAGLGA